MPEARARFQTAATSPGARVASRSAWRYWLRAALLAAAVLVWVEKATAQPTSPIPAPTRSAPQGLSDFVKAGPEIWTSPQGLSASLQIVLLLTVLSLVPAVLLMTTSFVRIIVVLGLLRQALGLQQIPPSQVITSIALFLTVLIMMPVWMDV